MGQKLLITEEEKNRILNLYNKNNISEQQVDLAKAYSDYSANINNYPECVKLMGKPTKVKEPQLREFTHGILGKGNLKGFTFFPFRILDENKWQPDKNVPADVNKPGSYDAQSRIKYSCKGNMIEIEGKQYPATRIPSSFEELAKGGYYLKQGDKGPLVSRIQTKLQSAGEMVKSTGIFDADTTNAVKSFQTKQNPPLKDDGIVGKNTWAKLSLVSDEIKTAQPKTVTSVSTNSTEQKPVSRYGEVGPQEYNPTAQN